MAQTLTRQASPLRRLAGVDVVLIATTLVVSAVGVLMVYTATRDKLLAAHLDPRYYLKRELIFLALGVVTMVITAAIDYRRWEEWGMLVYGAVFLGLLAVLSPLGSSALGSQRWIPLGFFQLQPSAFAAVGLVLAAAAYCNRYADPGLSAGHLAVLLAITGVPMIIVIKQPDLGTGITMGVVLMVVLATSGLRGRWLALLAAMVVIGAVAVIQLGLLKHYQVARLSVFLHQGQGGGVSSGADAYNLAQSKIAIGSGGLFGKGLFHGTQTNLAYVPEQQTDFIFTAVGEQLGFVGSATVLALFGVIVWRVWHTALIARDLFGRLVAAGVIGLIGFSVFENAGMTMGIMPITGIPLPFMSYGGSAEIAFFAAVGLALSVHRRSVR